jgi:hypothetical protein
LRHADPTALLNCTPSPRPPLQLGHTTKVLYLFGDLLAAVASHYRRDHALHQVRPQAALLRDFELRDAAPHHHQPACVCRRSTSHVTTSPLCCLWCMQAQKTCGHPAHLTAATFPSTFQEYVDRSAAAVRFFVRDVHAPAPCLSSHCTFCAATARDEFTSHVVDAQLLEGAKQQCANTPEYTPAQCPPAVCLCCCTGVRTCSAWSSICTTGCTRQLPMTCCL